MPGDPDQSSPDPLEDALYRWLDPEGFSSRSSRSGPRRAEVGARDRARLETIVSESSADHRRVVDPEIVRRARSRPVRARSRSRAACVLVGIGVLLAIVSIAWFLSEA